MMTRFDIASGFCRDCLTPLASAADRCPVCNSPRIAAHPELAQLSTAHVDCDAFYATVEKRDAPELADRPVIVGGGNRGVVATACYVARTYGVRSAMPMFKALRACPDAVVIRPNMRKYSAVSRQVRELMAELTPTVEPISIDEAFIDLSGTERLHHAPPALVLARFQNRVERELGITVSIGLSHNKFLAKVASDLEKPRGFAVIGRQETLAFLSDRPVSLIWGVGKVMQTRLARDGISRIGDLQRMPEHTLVTRYGSLGVRLARLARGEDARDITASHGAKSISAETTFDHDIAIADDLLPPLRELCEKVSRRLKASDLASHNVVLKLKSSSFHLSTRSARLSAATNLSDRLFRTARDLLLKELDGTRFRLIGIAAADLTAATRESHDDLLDPASEKRAKVESAIDAVRARYGDDGLELGITFRARPVRSGYQGAGQVVAAKGSTVSSDPDNT